MRTLVRFVVVLVAALAATPVESRAAQAPAQALAPELEAQVSESFRVLVVRDGVVLTPRRGPSRSIEVTNGSIAIDGTTVTGRELRDRLGADADLVLQLSYASPDALRAAFGEPPAAPAAPSAPAAPPAAAEPPAATAPAAPDAPEPPAPPDRWRRKSGAKVNIGGDITVEEDERVTEAVVAIGGDVDVRGRVDDDVVAVGGNVRLGPQGVVNGSVTSVGGRVEQDRGAEIRGEVNEIGFYGPWHAGGHGWSAFGREFFGGWFRLAGTLMRIALVLLLALIVALAASRPVERIARRAGDEPYLSGFVGILAQLLFVPVLVLTVVVLAVSIIGIPLLLLVPFALVALLFGVLMGFTGVARRVGTWAVGPARNPLVATAVGVVLITAVALLTRLLWLIPGPIAPVAIVFGIVAVAVEYVAWTVGLGALILTRFGTRGPLVPTYVDTTSMPPVPPPIPATESPVD